MTTLAKGSSIEIDLVRAALTPDYEVIEELGRGGMAVVYRAREVALDREVAIKVLPALLAMDAEFVERFQHEARTAGKLEHPNIVPIYRVGQSGHVTYFVMKYLRGQSLSAILRERPKIPAREVQRILIETASALGYAAKFGVVHRDIKPDNILLDHEGRCVITDFGIAKTSGARLTAPGTSMGTPRYMSPEHAQGVPMDGRSDIYSLGVVAYQALTGTIPFDGEDPFAVLYKHVNSPLPRPDLASTEETTLYSVIERMLAKVPEERFQSAEDLLAALGVTSTSTTLVTHIPGRVGELVPTEIISTAPQTLLARIGRMELKGWKLVAAGAGAVVALGGISAWAATRGPDVDTLATAARGVTTAGAASVPARMETLAAVVPPPIAVAPPKPPPEPYSRCSRDRTSLFLMADNVTTQKRGSSLTVKYDLCGLPKGTPYTLALTVRKTDHRSILGRKAPEVTETYPDVVDGPRTRRQKTIDISAMPTGKYQLVIEVTDSKRNSGERLREFTIVNP
jgi:hypothetical protein